MTQATQGRLQDTNGRRFRKEPDAGLCAIHRLQQMQAAGGAPPVVVECGCWHEDQTRLLAEALAWLNHDWTKVPTSDAWAWHAPMLLVALAQHMARGWKGLPLHYMLAVGFCPWQAQAKGACLIDWQAEAKGACPI